MISELPTWGNIALVFATFILVAGGIGTFVTMARKYHQLWKILKQKNRGL